MALGVKFARFEVMANDGVSKAKEGWPVLDLLFEDGSAARVWSVNQKFLLNGTKVVNLGPDWEGRLSVTRVVEPGKKMLLDGFTDDREVVALTERLLSDEFEKGKVLIGG